MARLAHFKTSHVPAKYLTIQTVLFFFFLQKSGTHRKQRTVAQFFQVVTATVFSHLSGPTERMTRSICESVEMPAMYV